MELCPRLTPTPPWRVLHSLGAFGNWSLSRAGEGTDLNVLICVQGKEVAGLREREKKTLVAQILKMRNSKHSREKGSHHYTVLLAQELLSDHFS